MIIYSQHLAAQLNKFIAPIYLLVGKEIYLLEDSIKLIKKTYAHQKKDYDNRLLTIDKPSDWSLLLQEACSLSLFNSCLILDIYFDRKNLDKEAIKTWKTYLNQPNLNCLIIIRAYQLVYKDYAWLKNDSHAVVVSAPSLTSHQAKLWLNQQFKKANINCEPKLIDYIETHTHNNLLAARQLIEKIIWSGVGHVDISVIEAHLSNQSDYQGYELSQICLSGNAQALKTLFDSSFKNKVEPILALWLLSQDIRWLIQLIPHAHQASFNAFSQQLNIPNHKVCLYKNYLQSDLSKFLLQLLSLCQKADYQLKCNRTAHPWHLIEQIAFSLCLKKPIFDAL